MEEMSSTRARSYLKLEKYKEMELFVSGLLDESE